MTRLGLMRTLYDHALWMNAELCIFQPSYHSESVGAFTSNRISASASPWAGLVVAISITRVHCYQVTGADVARGEKPHAGTLNVRRSNMHARQLQSRESGLQVNLHDWQALFSRQLNKLAQGRKAFAHFSKCHQIILGDRHQNLTERVVEMAKCR